MNEPTERRFDDCLRLPESYRTIRSIRETGREDGVQRFRRLGNRVLSANRWCFPNRGQAPCGLRFDVVERDTFNAFAWFDGEDHWIVFHSGTFPRMAGFLAAVLSSSGFLEGLGLSRESVATPGGLREVALRMAIETLFQHEWTHVLLGHTGHWHAAAPQFAASDGSRVGPSFPRDAGRVAKEYFADFFTAERLYEGARTRSFVFLEADELPRPEDDRSLIYMAFLGGLANFSLMRANQQEDVACYPSLAARMTTLFQGFLARADKESSGFDDIARLVSGVRNNLRAGLEGLPFEGIPEAIELLDAMDSETGADAALDEIRAIEQSAGAFLPEWAPHCVGLAAP